MVLTVLTVLAVLAVLAVLIVRVHMCISRKSVRGLAVVSEGQEEEEEEVS